MPQALRAVPHQSLSLPWAATSLLAALALTACVDNGPVAPLPATPPAASVASDAKGNQAVLGDRLAYLWAQTASPPINTPYAPDAQRNYNGKGLLNRVTRVATGNYSVLLGGMAKGATQLKETVIVTPYSQVKVRCSVAWDDLGADLEVFVSCQDQAGAPMDSRFTLLFVGDNTLSGRQGFALADSPLAPSYSPNALFSYTSSGFPISITHTPATGLYTVDFGLTRPPGGLPEVYMLTTWGGSANRLCSLITAPGPANLECYSAFTGVSSEALFDILLVEQGRPGMRFGFARADQPSAPTSYTANPLWSTSTGGPITITRTQKGVYNVDFIGLQKPVATRTEIVQVSSVGPGAHVCTVPAWPKTPAGNGIRVWVVCRNNLGQVVDAQFNVLVLE